MFYESIGAVSYTIGYNGSDGQNHLASVLNPGGFAEEGPLAALPDELRPDYRDYGYTSRLTCRRTVMWLNAKELLICRPTTPDGRRLGRALRGIHTFDGVLDALDGEHVDPDNLTEDEAAAVRTLLDVAEAVER